ncbi:Pre-mRNA-splicing factor [Physocladia obscura]|uniref:Pre-mRNA-splicing factor n=1 Tax=Physocladia obscura TaxID=109957 RepID=A0AAD5T2M5_9FUNG|nr:Pre-mRNA-splicing factor [Physocladia obscura]
MNSAHKAVVAFVPLLARPARAQSSEFGGKDQQPTGSVFNIWYSKWAGGDRINTQALEKAEHRCSILNDCGYTRAVKSSSFCIHFARGFWHRIPLAVDRVPMAQDVFGRDRHRDERDDMGGVGSFEKDNRTLYVGQLGLEGGLEDILYRHFIEWGEIEYLRLLKGKGVAFIRYKSRVSAEFAKEAMHCQSLDNNEILNVRWATEDPNPKAVLINKRKAEEKVVDALKSSLPVIGEHGTILDYQTRALSNASGAISETSNAVVESIGPGIINTNPDGPRVTKEIGWDTPNGFFYASNEGAMIASRGALDQSVQPNREVEELDDGISGESSAAILEGYGGPEKTQAWDGAKYVLGVGQSRIYTGEGQGHAAVRTKIVEAAVSGNLGDDIGVGGVSQGGAGSGGVAGLGSVAKGGFWPLIPQQQLALKRARVDEMDQYKQQQEQQQEKASAAPPAVSPTIPAVGVGNSIVSASTMQYLVELNQKRRLAANNPTSAVGTRQKRKATIGVLGVDYASDSE